MRTNNTSEDYYQNESEFGPDLYPVTPPKKIIIEETGQATPIPRFQQKLGR